MAGGNQGGCPPPAAKGVWQCPGGSPQGDGAAPCGPAGMGTSQQLPYAPQWELLGTRPERTWGSLCLSFPVWHWALPIYSPREQRGCRRSREPRGAGVGPCRSLTFVMPLGLGLGDGWIWVSGTGGTGGFLGAAKRCAVLTSTRCALCLSRGGDDDPWDAPHGSGACGGAGFWHGHCPLCCTSVVVGTRGQSSSAQGQERMEVEENPGVCALGSGTNATSWSFGFFEVIVTAALVSLRVVGTGSSAQDPCP